jgi:beta-glucosidase/6-phospho-beta-glucosidase/beta-galactosidase
LAPAIQGYHSLVANILDALSALIADPVYPPSLYRAVSYASTLGVPVYILENGMPSAQDDERRTEWIDGCLAEVRPCMLQPFQTFDS